MGLVKAAAGMGMEARGYNQRPALTPSTILLLSFILISFRLSTNCIFLLSPCITDYPPNHLFIRLNKFLSYSV